jgi:hypothetical protein
MPTGRTKSQRVSTRLDKQEARQNLRNKKRATRLKKKEIKGKKQVAGKILNKPGLTARGQAKIDKSKAAVKAGPKRTVKVSKKDGTTTKTVTRKNKGVTTTKKVGFNTKTGRKKTVNVAKTGSRPAPKAKTDRVKRTRSNDVTGKTKVQSALSKLKDLTKGKKKK